MNVTGGATWSPRRESTALRGSCLLGPGAVPPLTSFHIHPVHTPESVHLIAPKRLANTSAEVFNSNFAPNIKASRQIVPAGYIIVFIVVGLVHEHLVNTARHSCFDGRFLKHISSRRQTLPLTFG